LRSVRRNLDVLEHLWNDKRAQIPPEHVQPFASNHHTVRIELSSALRTKQINAT